MVTQTKLNAYKEIERLKKEVSLLAQRLSKVDDSKIVNSLKTEIALLKLQLEKPSEEQAASYTQKIQNLRSENQKLHDRIKVYESKNCICPTCSKEYKPRISHTCKECRDKSICQKKKTYKSWLVAHSTLVFNKAFGFLPSRFRAYECYYCKLYHFTSDTNPKYKNGEQIN